ncbi:NAD(P)-dependent oxidoreductase [Bacteriovoracales bacterium]|nr:NAD(P)-dependent oxidoreductase [Bacteriovoracales bacterium]
MKKVLVSGGAGYIGSVMIRLLLEKGYKTRVIDKLEFGGESIVDLLNNNDFEFIKGDIRQKDDLKKALKDIDYVVHLASIVGDPACAQEPELATSTNFEGTKLFYNLANEMGVKKFLFASTCSNYGKMDDPSTLINEESPLNPISLYAETKVKSERFLLDQPKSSICKPTILRLSTVYGLSPRPRFDLTVNEFTRDLALDKELLIFGEQFWRPYCHVVDLARAFITVIGSSEKDVAFDVFNVGNTDENYQKKMLVDEISKQIPNVKIKYVHKEEDPRDYRVSFEKISSKLGYKTTKTVPEGIRDIISSVQLGFFKDPYDAKYKNIR